jgi:hypothetical protein
MYLPQLNELDRDREMIEVFKGYNHNLRISEGEFYDMKNLTSNNYPVISPRPLRGVYKDNVTASSMIAKDGLCYIVGGELYCDNGKTIKTTDGLGIPSADVVQLVSLGAYVIIVGNEYKKFVNLSDMSYGDIDVEFVSKSSMVYLCDIEGNSYSEIKTVKPSNPNDQCVWIDTNTSPFSSYVYYEAEGKWQLTKTYIGIYAAGIDLAFDVGDSVQLSTTEEVDEVDLTKSVTIANKFKDWIIVPGVIKRNYEEDFSIYVERKMPDMDFIIESGNRLWGCFYGKKENGFVNEIYASKLGDFKNWYTYQGISTDSYAVSVGSDGEFTGAITYKGQPIFFKENHIHKIYGTMPSNYQMQTTECRGVMKGANKSLAIVNEVLYYKSRGAVCMYDGSYPTEVSQAFGEKMYGDAVGGALGSKYYISLKSLDRSTDINSVYELFVFDTSKGLWHKEDETEIKECASYMSNLYYIDGKQPSKIKTFLKGSNKGEKEVRWMAKTGVIGLSNPDRRYISKINIRASTTVGSWFSVFIKYNSMGDWIYVGRVMGATLESFNLPIIPRRCDHFQLKFEGVGEVKIYSICKTIEKGGDY